MTEHECLHQWFEVRLRLIACQRLAGADNRIEPLAKQLEAWRKQGLKAVDVDGQVGNKDRLAGRLVRMYARAPATAIAAKTRLT